MASPNPYASNFSAVPIGADSQGEGVLFTIAGLLLGALAAAGSALRLVAVFSHRPGQWRTLEAKISDGAPLVGLSIFAVTACTLLVVMLSRGTMRKQDLCISQAFIVIATLAMLSRTLFEPNFTWTPHWPSYLLTISAGVSMVMFWRRFRATDGNAALAS